MLKQEHIKMLSNKIEDLLVALNENDYDDNENDVVDSICDKIQEQIDELNKNKQTH